MSETLGKGFHRIEDDIDMEQWARDYAALGIGEIEEFLGKYAEHLSQPPESSADLGHVAIEGSNTEKPQD